MCTHLLDLLSNGTIMLSLPLPNQNADPVASNPCMPSSVGLSTTMETSVELPARQSVL